MKKVKVYLLSGLAVELFSLSKDVTINEIREAMREAYQNGSKFMRWSGEHLVLINIDSIELLERLTMAKSKSKSKSRRRKKRQRREEHKAKREEKQ